jgi:hypothetical protein
VLSGYIANNNIFGTCANLYEYTIADATTPTTAYTGSKLQFNMETAFKSKLGVGTAANSASLIMDVQSTSYASRPAPKMTSTQIAGLTKVAGGQAYDSDANKLQICNGSSWEQVLCGSTVPAPPYTSTQISGLTKVAGSIVYNSNTNKLQVCNGSSWETITSA